MQRGVKVAALVALLVGTPACGAPSSPSGSPSEGSSRILSVPVVGYVVKGDSHLLVVYVLTNQNARLERVVVSEQTSTRVRLEAAVAQSEGPAVGMSGYLFDTVRLDAPLSGRAVIDSTGSPIPALDAGQVDFKPGETRRATWEPGH